MTIQILFPPLFPTATFSVVQCFAEIPKITASNLSMFCQLEPKKVQRKQSKGKQIQSKNTEQKSDQKITKPKISKVVSKVDLNAKATKAAPVKKRDSKLQDKVKIGKAKDGKTIEERVIDLKKIDKQIDAQLKKQKGKQAKVKEVKAKAKQVKPKVVKTQPKADNYGKADFVSDFEDDLSEEVIPKKRGAGGKIQNRAGQDKGSKPCIPKKTNKRKKVEIPEEYTKVLQNPDDLLIEDLEQDVFDNSPELKSLDCCVQCANTNVIRAAATQNHDLMKKCIDAKQHISSLLIAQSPEFKWTPLEYAISNGDKQTFDMLMNYQQHRSRRVNLGQTQLKEFDTGSVSNQAYGVEIRKVNMSRGNKLGNNAFLQETVVEENGFQEYLQNEYFIERMVLMEKLDYEFIQKIIKLDVSMKTFVNNTLIQKLLINNKVEIVEKLIAPVVNDPLFQVNQLLYATLVAQDLNQLPKNYNKLSVNKTSVFGGISSLHSAALNPNLEILKRLLVMIKSNDNLSRQKDDEGNECIHYAAACSSTGPLELLLARNFNVNSENNNKQTPIFIAVKCKQIQNIKIIMEEDETAIYYKDKSGNYPIHVAAKAGSIECLKALCKIEKDYINIQNGFHHLSPLMHAASYGRLEAVEFMVDKLKADINQVDKHDRNALLYAVRNGHTRIARFLITRGAYFNYPDDSLNYPFHYACAYGWLDCIKLLIRAGASISNANEWGFTPLIIAMMKGHKKIVDFLLDIDGIDVNSTDDKGRNLLCFSMMKFEEKTTDYVKHLIEQKGANPNQEDINKLTPFYYLLHAPYYSHKKSIKDYTTNRYQDKVITMQKSYYKLVEYLITVQGCDIQQFAKLNQSPLDMILQQNKLFLLPLFNLKLNINQNPDLMFKMTPKNDDNDNEVFIDFLNKHEKIDENILNGCNSQGYTILIAIMNQLSTTTHLQNFFLNQYFQKALFLQLSENQKISLSI
ncbi:ankyrin repeat-containing protein [Stylonychia lemnae]|uniref:Ankyrin repeat-containing protein n=1 Tax=Stylonychia lemnae TaxID=5949 RepID=A0A077ZXA6_STYLE|nr:ankyrin repeat-containing protein [Stylonychia lemnae]|eukprot:CDW74196.1 ankyrin repeat-containing protein [Stylonychia lemnae]